MFAKYSKCKVNNNVFTFFQYFHLFVTKYYGLLEVFFTKTFNFFFLTFLQSKAEEYFSTSLQCVYLKEKTDTTDNPRGGHAP